MSKKTKIMKAIETIWRGYRFRSRTEARWAVFFEAIKLPWIYEHEGFNLEDGSKYLPDFYFPTQKMYAEVKGDKFTEREIEKCRLLSLQCEHVLLLDGPPDAKYYETFTDGHESSGIIFMGRSHKFWPFYFGYDFEESYMSETIDAINASRAARFEHGETPVITAPTF